MTFNDYQKQAITTDKFLSKRGDITSLAFTDKVLGLFGESGEIAEKLKKIYRDKEGVLSSEDKEAILIELGDLLWYLSATAYYLDVPLDKIAELNLHKVLGRKARGVISGTGDNR